MEREGEQKKNSNSLSLLLSQSEVCAAQDAPAAIRESFGKPLIILKNSVGSDQTQWCTPVIPALRRLRQGNCLKVRPVWSA